MTVKRVCPFPVGGIYFATDSTDPATIWPNTSWERIRGKFLMAEDDSHAAGTSGGSSTHTLTTDELPAHKHTVPAHGHAHTIKATTPQFTHSITQPAFTIPNHVHSNTHAHGVGFSPLMHGSGGKGEGSANLTTGVYPTMRWFTDHREPKVDNYTGNTGNPTSLPACTRSTNVAVGAHAASACTMSGGVTDKAAFDTESSGGVSVLHAPAVPVGLRLEEGRVRRGAETSPVFARGWRDAA